MEEMYTERLVLRRWRASDLDELHGLLCDAATARDAGFRPSSSPEESLVRLSGMIRSSDAWAVTLKGDDAPVGWIRFRPDDLRRRPKCFQIGYAMRPDMRRKGYMKEALEEAMNYVFLRAGAQIVSARVFPDNAASIRTLISNGFSLSGRLPEYGSRSAGEPREDVLLFTRRSSDSAKRDDPSMMARQIASLCDPSDGWLTCLSNAVAFIYSEMEMLNWAGVYFLKNEKLYLGPFN